MRLNAALIYGRSSTPTEVQDKLFAPRMKISPFLWFDDQAEQAAKFYTSIFADSKINSVSRYGEAGPGRKGSVMGVSFRLLGQDFMALNGGPLYTFTPAISMFVSCKTQREVDTLWRKLCKGGKPNRCGWLTDKYGLSWQIVPTILTELLQSKDREVAHRTMKAMLGMRKLDIAQLKRAARGPSKRPARRSR
jgi:predicted 3-demethylubiquinone-9 3-methyltransferase (glyoxalase superfamily)